MNRGHAFVTPEDVEEGLRLMARYLVSDFAYEMRDILGTPENILYSFIGSQGLMTEVEIGSILGNEGFCQHWRQCNEFWNLVACVGLGA
jgi:hypothetical protein